MSDTLMGIFVRILLGTGLLGSLLIAGFLIRLLVEVALMYPITFAIVPVFLIISYYLGGRMYDQ